MVIKNIAKLCKKTGIVQLFYDESRDVQWIGNGCACWALYGMPMLDGENVLTALDIPEKDWPKIVVRETAAPQEFDLSDMADEEELKDPVVSISYGGQLVIPLKSRVGTILADPEHFRPMKDVDHLTVHARMTVGGKIYLAAKGGLLLQGIILPKELKTFAALPDILAELSQSLEKSIIEEAEQLGQAEPEEFSAQVEQYTIDPETGEVVE